MEKETLGERIFHLMRKSDLSHKQFAKKIGVTNSTLTKYIGNIWIPKGTTIADMARVLHTTTDYLLGLEREEDPDIEYNYVQRIIARNVKKWTQKQKADLVNALFEVKGTENMKVSEEKHEINKILMLSTGHLTKETADSMDLKLLEHPIFYDKEGYGWFVVVSDWDDDDEVVKILIEDF